MKGALSALLFYQGHKKGRLKSALLHYVSRLFIPTHTLAGTLLYISARCLNTLPNGYSQLTSLLYVSPMIGLGPLHE